MLYDCIRRLGTKKKGDTFKSLGYSPIEFKEHFEKLFECNMSWDNHGKWHIDHIRPVSSFDKNTPLNVINSLDNLQPLWAEDNLKKGDSF